MRGYLRTLDWSGRLLRELRGSGRDGGCRRRSLANWAHLYRGHDSACPVLRALADRVDGLQSIDHRVMSPDTKAGRALVARPLNIWT